MKVIKPHLSFVNKKFIYKRQVCKLLITRESIVTNIFDFEDYKEFLKNYCRLRDITFASIAGAAGVHRQYFTKVLHDKAHLNDEQAVNVAVHLDLNEAEMSYFLLLVQEAKTTGKIAKSYFCGARQKLKKHGTQSKLKLAASTKRTNVQTQIDLSEYYLDINLQLCHLHLFIGEYQKDVDLLTTKLQVTRDRLNTYLQKLLDLGLATKVGNRWNAKEPLLHLEKGSIVSEQNHRNWRLQAAQVSSAKQSKELFFTGTVVSEVKVKEALKAEIRNLLTQFQEKLQGTKDEHVFQINIDIFGV